MPTMYICHRLCLLAYILKRCHPYKQRREGLKLPPKERLEAVKLQLE